MRRFCLQFLVSLLPAIPAVAQEQLPPPQTPPQEAVFELDKTIPDTQLDESRIEITPPPPAMKETSLTPQVPLKKIFSREGKVNAAMQHARAETEAVMTGLRREIDALEVRRKEMEEESVRAMAEREDKGDGMVRSVLLAQASQIEEAAKEGVTILNEELVVLRKRLQDEGELLEAREEHVRLMGRRARLRQEVKSVSLLEAATAREEVEVVKAYLQEARDRENSRRDLLEDAQERLDLVQEEVEGMRERIKKESELLQILPFRKEDTPQRFVRNIKLLHEIQLANMNDRIATAEQEIKLYQTRRERAQIETSNARLKVELMTERAALLEERAETDELSRIEREIQRAQREEGERKKQAALDKKALHAKKVEALRKAEDIARQKEVASSPEERQTLELEAILYELRGDIAKKKEYQITEETRRYETNTRLKKLNRDVMRALGGENTQYEVAVDLSVLNRETEKWERNLAVVNSLADATQKEKHLLTERLKRAREEIAVPPGGVSKVAREAADFKDQTIAEKYIAFANERVKLLEEDLRIVEVLGEKIQKERREVILQGLQLLATSQGKLSDIKESNVWVRREWSNSLSAMKSSITRVSVNRKRLRLVRMPKRTSETKVHMSVAIAGIVLLVAATVCGSYYGRKWCKGNLAKLKEVNG
ncbi:MAG: hypothetical protein GY800_03170 [Planctomycetes bacterium]|nr:hypothetical protein [Planctomycetota bacterium]